MKIKKTKILKIAFLSIIIVFTSCYENPFGSEILLPSGKSVLVFEGNGFSFKWQIVSTDVGTMDIFFSKMFDGSLRLGRYAHSVIYHYNNIEESTALADITSAPDPSAIEYEANIVPLLNHIYIINTLDGRFAKIKITKVSSDSVTFDWVYQPDGTRNFFVNYSETGK